MTMLKPGRTVGLVAALLLPFVGSCAPVAKPVVDFDVVEATIPEMQQDGGGARDLT